MECVSGIDLMKVDGVIDGECHMRALVVLDRMASMLTGLIKKPM